MMAKIQKRTINSSKIHTPLAQGLVLIVMLMEWTGRPLQPRKKTTKVGPKIETLQIYTCTKRFRPRPPDQLPPQCSHGCQQTYIESLALSPLLFALQT